MNRKPNQFKIYDMINFKRESAENSNNNLSNNYVDDEIDQSINNYD